MNQLATPKQLRYIGMLLTYKGKSKETIYEYFKIDTMKKLTLQQAEKVIDKLLTYPDVKTPIWQK